MNNLELASRLIDLVGGKDNVIKITNCMTRMRVTLKNLSLVNISDLKQTEGVLGVVEDGPTLQIVLGPGKAKKVTDEAVEAFSLPRVALETGEWEQNKDAVKSMQKQGPFKTAVRNIAEIFIPLIPAIIAAGLFNGFGSLIQTLQGQAILPPEGFWLITRLLFQLIGSAFLAYFAVYTGINAAKQFGATEGLGGMIGGISIGANVVEISKIFNLYNVDTPLRSVLTTGKGGIIGVIVGVWILSKVEKWVRKNVPDVLDLIITPFVTMLVMAVLFVFIIMPATGFLSDGLVNVLGVIINSDIPFVSVLSGYILSALFLPMVLLGLHHGLIPIYAIQLEAMGGVSLFPVLAMAGAGQVGAAIAIYLKAKRVGNIRMQKVITGALPAGFLGVGEPLIYGVTLPMFTPFITAGLGAGFGGAYVMLMKVMATAWGPSGLVALPLMQPQSTIHYFIGLLVSYIGGFIITYIFIKDKAVAEV
jgi:sucrose PTS system EIIBCA or EIIBC component